VTLVSRATIVQLSTDRTSRVLVGRVSTLDALVQSLRRQILEGAIAPGTRLAEVELAEAHGVSRQSMRSALAELVHIGILDRAPHRGVWVRVLTPPELRDLWSVRALVELEAVRRAMAAPADWSRVHGAVRAIASLTPASSWADSVEADLAFHRATVEASGSEHLVRIHGLLMGELSLALAGNLNNEPPGLMTGEHRRLLEAFEGDDVEAAVAMLEEHLQEGLDIGTRVRLASEPRSNGSLEEKRG
jgi:DNA-binding GntR family transcriptional regulator